MPVRDPEGLVARAREVLDGNWLGHATRPGPHLYPHQWSWDAAFIAIGLAHHDPDRAWTDLLSLFSGQWANGLLPHIVFHARTETYFPGPEVWAIERSPNAPRDVRTSGIVQPPVHATAVWRLFRRDPDRTRAEAAARALLPSLRAWHAYLQRDRDPDGAGVVDLRHPWESGQDNSPAWDAPLQAIAPPAGSVPRYRRVDLTMVPAHERPRPADYDAYVALVECFKGHDYDERAVRHHCPFVVVDPVTNALLAGAEEDLASLADALGEDGDPHRARAAQVAAAMNDLLWSDEHGCYLAHDHREGRAIPAPVVGGLVPLVCAAPDDARVDAMVAELRSERFWRRGTEGFPVTSVGRDAPTFSHTRYWRGPVWVNMNWLLVQGLLRHGRLETAAELRAATLQLVDRHGFFEYYHPHTGEGLGSERFSWSAALTIDLLLDDRFADAFAG